jgi:hypothetical protein
MNIQKLAEIDEKLEYFKNEVPLYLGGLILFKDFGKDVDTDKFKKEQIRICAEYLQELQSFSINTEPVNKILGGLNEIKEISEQRLQCIYVDCDSFFDDFCLDTGNYWKNSHGVFIDPDTGYPARDPDEMLIRNFNKDYQNPVLVLEYLYGLFIQGLDLIIHDLGVNQIAHLIQNEPIQQQITAPTELDTASGNINYKVLLLHGLGVLRPLKKEYEERNPGANKDEFAKLIADLIGAENQIKTVLREIDKTNNLHELSQKVINRVNAQLSKHNLKSLHDK